MAAMHGRGGSVCQLLGSGTIRVGDTVDCELPAAIAAGSAPGDR